MYPKKLGKIQKNKLQIDYNISVDTKSLLKKSYKYLSFRARSESEILEYLSKKTSNEALVTEVIKTLRNQGLINDNDFIDQFINSYLKKGYGPTKIRFNLLKKGVEKEDLNLKLDKISDSQWLKSAKIVILKKKKQLDQLDRFKLKQKIYQLLTYKGHKYSIIKAIIDAYPHLE